MTHIFIHPKFGKTGTTSIQSFFANNRNRLLSDCGLLYPRNGTGIMEASSHHGIALSFNNKVDDLPFDRLVDRLTSEIVECKPDKVFLSSEILDSAILSSAIFSSFLEKLASSLTIVFTVRDQASWLMSMLSQIVLDLDSDIHVSPFTGGLYLRHELDFFDEVEKWRSSRFSPVIKLVPSFRDSLSGVLRVLNIAPGKNISPLLKRLNISLPASRLMVASKIKDALYSLQCSPQPVNVQVNGFMTPLSSVQAFYYSISQALQDLPEQELLTREIYFRAADQEALMKLYAPSNMLLQAYCPDEPLFPERRYDDVLSFNAMTEAGACQIAKHLDGLRLSVGHKYVNLAADLLTSNVVVG